MKRVLAFLLAVALIATVAAVCASAKGGQHFEFGWNHGFEGENKPQDRPQTDTDCPKPQPEKPDHEQGKPATDTDCPEPDHDGDKHPQPETNTDCPAVMPQRPQRPQRPQTDTDLPQTDSDVATDTDVAPEFNDIFDVIVELHKHGHHGKDFRVPKHDHRFALLDMVIDGDKVHFGFCRLDQEAPAFEEIAMEDLVNPPEGMDVIEMGDNNADGVVGADDALNILKHVVGTKPMHHQGEQIISDMTEDDVVGADDALCVLKKIVGKSY